MSITNNEITQNSKSETKNSQSCVPLMGGGGAESANTHKEGKIVMIRTVVLGCYSWFEFLLSFFDFYFHPVINIFFSSWERPETNIETLLAS